MVPLAEIDVLVKALVFRRQAERPAGQERRLETLNLVHFSTFNKWTDRWMDARWACV